MQYIITVATLDGAIMSRLFDRYDFSHEEYLYIKDKFLDKKLRTVVLSRQIDERLFQVIACCGAIKDFSDHEVTEYANQER